MKNKLYFGKGLIIFCLAALCMTGCGQKETEEVTEITLMHGWGGSIRTHETMQAIFDEFVNENPDIRLICQALPDSTVVIEKADEMLAVDKMPDIISTNGSADYVENVVRKGKALDLMPFIEEDPEFAKSVYQTVLDTWTTKEGAIYTLPDAMEESGYWYNADIFEKAGILTVPKTWAEFWEACDKIVAVGNGCMPFALEEVQAVEYLLPARIAGVSKRGEEFVGSQPKDFTDPVFITGIEELKKAYIYSAPVSTLNDAREAFRREKSAIYFNGVWECGEFNEMSSSKIRYANYPTDSGESLACISASSGYVVNNSKDKKKVEACVRFLKYILSEEVQTKIAIETGQAPSNPGVNVEMIKSGYPLLGDVLEVVNSSDIQIKSIHSTWSRQVLDKIRSSVDDVKSGEMSALNLAEILDKES